MQLQVNESALARISDISVEPTRHRFLLEDYLLKKALMWYQMCGMKVESSDSELRKGIKRYAESFRNRREIPFFVTSVNKRNNW